MAESADKNLHRRYIHQANVLLANFLSLLTFGLLFTGNVMYQKPPLSPMEVLDKEIIKLGPGLMPTHYSSIKCSLVLTMVYFSLYLNLITEFIRSVCEEDRLVFSQNSQLVRKIVFGQNSLPQDS